MLLVDCYLFKKSEKLFLNKRICLCVLQVLYIQAFVLVFLLGKFMGKVFFGQLRAAEMEVSLRVKGDRGSEMVALIGNQKA